MAYGPAGIGHLENGKTVFVEGVVPGDVISLRPEDNQGSFLRASLVKVLEPSPKRVAIYSAEDAACGSAPWQQLSYEAQLEAKRQNILGSLTHGARFSKDRAQSLVEPPKPSPRQWNYRNKLELACGPGSDGRFIVGLHKEHSSDIIPLDKTALGYKAIASSPKALRGAIRYGQGNSNLEIYRIGVRYSVTTKDLEVALWTPPGAFPRAAFAKILGEALKPTGIIRVLADPGKARKIKGVEVLAGKPTWHEELMGLDFYTQAPSFFQVNSPQAETLINLVIEGLSVDTGAYIADLFAGGGTFSIPLAQAGAAVVAVEAAGSSVRDLRANGERNGVDIAVVGGDATRELPALGDLDGLVVDPPRAGLSRPIIEAIAKAHPEKLAYVSCDPATWARDVVRIEEAGFELIKVTPVDMFPQTYHCELVSLFQNLHP